jgi:phosphoglycerate dehydrogenase-like enzyme
VKIQLLEPEAFPPAAARRLAELGPVIEGPTANTQDVTAVFTRLASVLDAEFHANYPALRWIVSPTTGLNHIDLDHFAASGVEVISLRERTEFLDNIHATAELTIALALALIRDLPAAVAAVRGGAWDRYPHKGNELHGKTVMIHGYGRIGRMVAPIYRGFGCRILANDIVPGRVPEDLRCDFAAALAETDVLSIHLPLNSETEGLVGREILARLPARAVVVNTSRGEILDQDYLLSSLEQGKLAGAALDVLTGEPDPVSPLLQARMNALGRRLIVTPHIGGFTQESLSTVEEFITGAFIDSVRARG